MGIDVSMFWKYNAELKPKWGGNLYYGIHSNYIKFMYANGSTNDELKQ